MSEVSQVFTKDAVDTIGNVLGTAGSATARTGASATTGTDGGVGNTFLTEPLWGQFVELLTEQSFVRQIARSIPMDQPTMRIPAISTGLQVYATTEGAEATATSMQADDFLLEAKKIMAQVIASAELYEDSVQNIEKIITDDFVRAIAQAEEQAFLLGRVTDPGAKPAGSVKAGSAYTEATKGTIASLTNMFSNAFHADSKYDYAEWGTQSDLKTGADATLIKGSPLEICDGVITTGLDEGNIVDMHGSSFYGGNAYKAIREAIYKLGLLGRNRKDLVLILNPVSANQLLQSDELLTLDKYGSNATILTGEVGSLFGVKILEYSFVPSAGITVSASGTSAQNGDYGKGGYGVLVHTPSLMLGDLRKVQVENERIIQNDAFRTVVSERIAFGMERRSGAVVIGNMDSTIETLTSASVFYPGGTTPTLSVDDDTLNITADGGNATCVLTLGSASDSLVYMGNSGLATGSQVAIDLAGGTTYGTAIADEAVPQVLDPTATSVGVKVTGSSSTSGNGTGTIYFQSINTSGASSGVVSISVAISGQDG